MTAGEALVAAVLAELRTDELQPLMVFDAPPVRASAPYAVIEEPAMKADNAAGVTGRVGTLAITYQDGGERPMRLRSRIALAEERVDLLPTAIGGGWRLAGLLLARSRLTRAKEGWLGRSEWVVRMYRVE